MTMADIDPKILQGIKEDLEDGMLENDAAIKWCSPTTYYRWKREIEEIDANGNVVMDDANPLVPKHPFEDFCLQAIVNYKQKLVRAANVNAVKNGIVALEVLRRRFPKEWNVPTKIDHGGEVSVAIKTVESIVDDLLEDEEDEEDTRPENIPNKEIS